MKRKIPALAALLVLAALLIGCGSADDVKDGGPVTTQPGPATTVTPGGSTTSSESQATTTTTPGGTIQLNVYFTWNEKVATAHRQVPYTKEVAKAAMEELLKGPNAQEKEVGMFTTVPANTLFLGIAVKDKVATVDLSKEYESGGGTLSMSLRLAQVVYTLTQFPTVSEVSFQLDGQPVTAFGGEGIILDHPVGRADYEDMTPAILVESPALGDIVTSPVHITGSANTFEATFVVELLDANGQVVAEKQVMATSGTGTRGTFAVDVPFTVDQAGNGTLKVFEQSAKDGSPINTVDIPIKLTK